MVTYDLLTRKRVTQDLRTGSTMLPNDILTCNAGLHMICGQVAQCYI